MSNVYTLMGQATGANYGVADSLEVKGQFLQMSFTSSFNSGSIGVGAGISGYTRYNIVVEGGGTIATNKDVTSTVEIGTASPIISLTRVVGQLPTSTSYKQWAGIHYGINTGGATRQVVVTTETGFSRSYGGRVYVVYVPEGYGLELYDTASTFGSTSMSITLDTPQGDSVMFAGAQFRNGESTPSLSFGGTSGLSTDTRLDTATNENFYSGSKLFRGANTGLTVTAEDTSAAGAESVLVGAVFKAVVL
jgi:hypothetical protein